MAATFAYHYARTDLVDEALRWLIRAADRAARVYPNAGAVMHLDLAARRLQQLPETPDRDRRRWDEGTATFDDATRTFERIGAWFEAQQTCDERDRLNGAIGNPR